MKVLILLSVIILLHTIPSIAYQSLPPDPGEAGKQTLLGVDSDNDGIRDDIQRYIFFSFPDDEKVRTALKYIAQEYQLLLLQANDPDAALVHATKKMRHGECLDYIMGEVAGDVIAALQAEILNTEERTVAYINFNKSLSGTVIQGAPLKEWKNSCAFDVDAINNN